MFSLTTETVIDKYGPLSAACDGMFLIFDTARHANVRITARECSDHVRSCTECRARLNGEDHSGPCGACGERIDYADGWYHVNGPHGHRAYPKA